MVIEQGKQRKSSILAPSSPKTSPPLWRSANCWKMVFTLNNDLRIFKRTFRDLSTLLKWAKPWAVKPCYSDSFCTQWADGPFLNSAAFGRFPVALQHSYGTSNCPYSMLVLGWLFIALKTLYKTLYAISSWKYPWGWICSIYTHILDTLHVGRDTRRSAGDDTGGVSTLHVISVEPSLMKR